MTMKVIIDTDKKILSCEENGSRHEIPLYEKEAFEILSDLWVKVGWNQKYEYTFSWFGRPIIQLPEDMVRFQEVVYRIKPDLIIETGIAHGGSLVYSASLCKAIGKGRVIGVDIEIRPVNRKAIESHELFPLITLIEGNSVDQDIVRNVRSLIQPEDRTVLVILDSNHTRNHVLRELELYSSFVTRDSYIIATDGIMHELHDAPRGKPSWIADNPSAAAQEFLKSHPEFVLEQPRWVFNESNLEKNITHWPGAWLRRT
jgi:cephalosporin hydroxylase